MLQAWSPAGSQAIDRGAHPSGFSGVGTQAADLGVHQPTALGLCARAASHLGNQATGPPITVLSILGFRFVLGLLMRCSESRG